MAVALALYVCDTHARDLPPPAANTQAGQAAMYAAIGLIAVGECPKIGFKANSNGWHALIEREQDGLKAMDFFKGGRFETVGRSAMAHVVLIFHDAGAESWCRYMAAWAKAAHPMIWRDLLYR